MPRESNEIAAEMIERVKKLIGTKDEINLEWLRVVTQIPVEIILKIAIQDLGMVPFEGAILSREKAERKLEKMQQAAQAEVEREALRKGAVRIDMMKLREKLWTAIFPERFMGQLRQQFSPIWTLLEDEESSITLQHDWIKRLEKAVAKGAYKITKEIEMKELINELGEDYRGKAKVILAKTYPRDSTIFDRGKPTWVMFLVSETENRIKLEGLHMLNILTLSTKFYSREKTYTALNEYLELINSLVSDPSIFEEVIICT